MWKYIQKGQNWLRWGTLAVCGWPSMKSFKVKFMHAYRGHIYVLYILAIGWSNFLHENWAKIWKMAKIWPLRGHQWPRNWRSRSQNNRSMALPIYTHIPNLKGRTKIMFKLSCPKGSLCGVTVLNPKYPQLSSGDTIGSHLLARNNKYQVCTGYFVLTFDLLSRIPCSVIAVSGPLT